MLHRPLMRTQRHERAGYRSAPTRTLLSVAFGLRQVREPGGTRPPLGGQSGTGDAGSQSTQTGSEHSACYRLKCSTHCGIEPSVTPSVCRTRSRQRAAGINSKSNAPRAITVNERTGLCVKPLMFPGYNTATSEVTKILVAMEHGDPAAAEALLPLVYEERKTVPREALHH